MPRSMRSPLVGSGTADHVALEMAVLKLRVVDPVVFRVVDTTSVVSVCVPAAVVYDSSRIA